MEYKANEVKAGCFVVFSILLLVFFLIVVSGMDLLKKTNTYLTHFKYTSGLEVGSLVRYGGMEVGKIKEMRISPEDDSYIEFLIEINADVPVKQDSRVFITSIGIMGEYYIEISTGSPDAKRAKPGSLLNCKEVTPLMMLTENVDKLTNQLSETIDGINQLLGQDNQQEFHQILANFNQLLDQNQQSVSSMMENMNLVLADLHSMSSKLDKMVGDNQDEISTSISHLEGTLKESKNAIKEFQSTLTMFNGMLSSQNVNYQDIMENLNRTTQNLDEFTKLIKEKPWSLIRKSAPAPREFEK
ncbi:MAG: MCE family protein [Calditrichaeota bacterium]|nr:MCE family protein [Calditrichota bacterium]